MWRFVYSFRPEGFGSNIGLLNALMGAAGALYAHTNQFIGPDNFGLLESALVLTGILGSIIVTPLMNAMGIRDFAARGFAVGVASHGIGTARAFQVSEEAGTFAGIAMGLNGALTALVFLALPIGDEDPLDLPGLAVAHVSSVPSRSPSESDRGVRLTSS